MADDYSSMLNEVIDSGVEAPQGILQFFENRAKKKPSPWAIGDKDAALALNDIKLPGQQTTLLQNACSYISKLDDDVEFEFTDALGLDSSKDRYRGASMAIVYRHEFMKRNGHCGGSESSVVENVLSAICAWFRAKKSK